MVKDFAHGCIIQLRGGKYGSEEKTQCDAELYVLGSCDQNQNLAGKMHQNPDAMSFIEKDDYLWMKKNTEDEHHFVMKGVGVTLAQAKERAHQIMEIGWKVNGPQ